MLELPETITIAGQINEYVEGKRILQVLPPTKPHKFCWFTGDAADYDTALRGAVIQSAKSFGIYVEISFDNGKYLCFNDGVNVRLAKKDSVPKSYQLLLNFDDATALVFTVSMYGSIILHEGDYDNEYYLKSKSALSPFTDEFNTYYRSLLASSIANLSIKAFLATEQRFPGIGNGVLQDILLTAHIHPKRKIGSLDKIEQDKLLSSIVSVLSKMIDEGGRNTEKNIFGQPGGYQTKLSKNTLTSPCIQCGGTIKKENYLGGSIYYCPLCQRIGE